MVKAFCWILFLVFLLLLTKNILFKRSPHYYKNYFNREYRNYKISDGWKQANTQPFSTIRLFYNSRRLNTEYKSNNLLGNLLGFLPLGFFLSLLVPWFRHWIKIFLVGCLLSFGYEAFQLTLGIGIFDVDDIILNTAGTLLGYLIFLMVRSVVLPSEEAIPN